VTRAFEQRVWKVTIDIRNPAPLLLRHDNVLVAGTNPIRNYLLWLLERIDRLAPIENQGIAVEGIAIEVEMIIGLDQLIDLGHESTIAFRFRYDGHDYGPGNKGNRNCNQDELTSHGSKSSQPKRTAEGEPKKPRQHRHDRE